MHLVKELAVLSTSLPEGIWLRVDEARIDAIKVGPSSYRSIALTDAVPM